MGTGVRDSGGVEWEAHVGSITLTEHARKKLQKRFGIATTADGCAFVLGVMLNAERIMPRYDGATAWRWGDVVVVTRYDPPTRCQVVLTCYPKSTMTQQKAKRRRAWKARKRLACDDDE